MPRGFLKDVSTRAMRVRLFTIALKDRYIVSQKASRMDLDDDRRASARFFRGMFCLRTLYRFQWNILDNSLQFETYQLRWQGFLFHRVNT